MASSEMSNTQQKVNIDFAQALQVQDNAGCKTESKDDFQMACFRVRRIFSKHYANNGVCFVQSVVSARGF